MRILNSLLKSLYSHKSAVALQCAFASNVSRIRNCAVIAHVDHGKTTLSGLKLNGDRVMDSIALERERGITIMAKNTSLVWKGNRFNIVDTPGHADFGGEVERVLSMVDGVLLVVDATEGPMTQTKFVLSKALSHNLQPIVIINKIDRDTARIDGSVEDQLFDLFVGLNASDEQLDFPILYASAREGWAVNDLMHINKKEKDLQPLFEAILTTIPPPRIDEHEPFKLLVTNMEHDSYLGRLVSGKVRSGNVRVGNTVKALTLKCDVSVDEAKISKIFRRCGLEREEIDVAYAGDIITLAGIHCGVTDTICAPSVTVSLSATPLDPPTLSLTFSVNDSPLQGKSGKKLTSAQIKERLYKEIENNVTLGLLPCAGDKIEVRGRGELQLVQSTNYVKKGILVEQMRREGFELTISSPTVLMRPANDGTEEEPMEEVIIDVPESFSGFIIHSMQKRGADLKQMHSSDNGSTRISFSASSRELMGFRSEAKRTTGGYRKVVKKPEGRSKTDKGKMYASCDGRATGSAIVGLETRGEFFIQPGDAVYKGMLVGECNRAENLVVNVAKTKKLTNIRSTESEEKIRTIPPRSMSLEDCISYIACHPGLKIEVTPEKIRMRKETL